ncbi:sigma-E processing peptidase SpoIIGA [Alkalihalobacterium elongatum]|uniref:sigma-E processing peptidase SpoIIGA n=1 Tax=Alkalihalobacterium elongatum TaxID=2675466 RepID=UPI001C1F2E83|nr:sigma-E processing peptidase SpoIIGA [Alkalihalobacterium elongatum]
MTIYLDVIWFLNLCIDFLLIWITAITLKRNIHKWRLFLAALFASLIVFFMFTPIGHLFYQPWMKILYSMAIVWIAFGFYRLTYFIQNLFMFYFVTFMTGGGLFALHFFWQTEIEILDGVMFTKTSGFGSTFSWIFVLIGFPLVWLFSKHQLKQVETRKIHYEQVVNVEISIGQDMLSMKGLVDSGNQLHDPITRAPVMVIEKDALHSMLNNEEIELLLDYENLEKIYEKNHPFCERIRIIPYRVVGKDQQFMIAIKPDHVKVTTANEQHLVKKVLIGINDIKLSNDGDYQCIVHPKMLVAGEGKKLA